MMKQITLIQENKKKYLLESNPTAVSYTHLLKKNRLETDYRYNVFYKIREIFENIWGRDAHTECDHSTRMGLKYIYFTV